MNLKHCYNLCASTTFSSIIWFGAEDAQAKEEDGVKRYGDTWAKAWKDDSRNATSLWRSSMIATYNDNKRAGHLLRLHAPGTASAKTNAFLTASLLMGCFYTCLKPHLPQTSYFYILCSEASLPVASILSGTGCAC